MKYLEDRIRREGIILPGNILKVGHFVNHQIEPELLREMAREFHRLYEKEQITKILTVEASGIAIAAAVSLEMNVPMVFAKKGTSSNVSGEIYSTQIHSFTHNRVYDVTMPRAYLSEKDRVLIVDDFLAQGCALRGLLEIVKASGASVAGCGIVIEKAFQDGGRDIRAQGIRVDSLARIASMDDKTGTITFID